MSLIKKFINNGILVGCGGGSGGGGTTLPENPINIGDVSYNYPTINNIEVTYIRKIYTIDDDLIINLKFNDNITISGSNPYININNQIRLDYFEGSGTQTLSFKKIISGADNNHNNIEIDFYQNEAIITDSSNQAYSINIEDLELPHIMIFTSYSKTSEYGYNEGMSVHISNYNTIFGKNILIGVVDSGLDRNHIDFKAKIIDGYDYGNEQFVLTVRGNHGSHVGGIISANVNGLGMHGYSFLSQLVDFRVFNNNGSWTANAPQMNEMSTLAASTGVHLMNNSWGYTGLYIDGKTSDGSLYNMNNFFYDDEISGYLFEGLDNKIVNVFAAGNDGYTSSGIMGGLPYLAGKSVTKNGITRNLRDLKNLWINVVSIDKSGKEAYYTNRAGDESYLWTISAHGGNTYTDGGVMSVESLGTYIRYQGTSMAAPTVTGGLALIMDKFLNDDNYNSSSNKHMTVELCVDRLFQTATYVGLTADGSKPSVANNKIFGYGKMDLDAALQDMTKVQFDALQTFSTNRFNAIDGLSTFSIDPSKKFINSVNKDRILF